MKKALLVIDLQNDYFPGFKFPLWNTDGCLENVLGSIKIAKEKGYPVILIQHIADPKLGLAPFFNEGTEGAEIVPEVLKAAGDAPIVIKTFADSFVSTTLNETLEKLGVEELLVCGMMTHNCVTHTAISDKKSKKYKTSIIMDASTSVSEAIHMIALHAASTWVDLINHQDI